MLEVFTWMSKSFGRIVGFIFNDLVVIESPRVTLGTFLLAFLIIGLVIYFLFDSDFIPGIGWSLNDRFNKGENEPVRNVPRHARGSKNIDFSTRESRHIYKK